MSGHVVPLRGSDAPWGSGQVTDSARCVLAPNASPWTLDGTNTWILTAPNSEHAVIVDPGPPDPTHLGAIDTALQQANAIPLVVLLTHGHIDHAEGAREVGERLGIGVRALDPAHRLGEEGLVGGDVIDVGTWRIDVVATPGHSADSVSFQVPHDASLLTGDTVLGRGTSLVAWPDGQLGDYLATLTRLRAQSDDLTTLLPGHGPALTDPSQVIDAYLAHRRARLEEVREVVASGVTEPGDVVAVVYRDVPKEVWPAAELTVRAQLAYLNSSRT